MATSSALPATHHDTIQALHRPACRRRTATHQTVQLPGAIRIDDGRQAQAPAGDLFGLSNFGVNLTRMAPNSVSALRHAHTKQDEFIYVLQGRPVLITDEGRTQLEPGMCAGFKAGTGNGHALVNESAEEVVYLEVGDRTPGDTVTYPDDDLQATLVDGSWKFAHKDGTPH